MRPGETAKKTNPQVAICHRLRKVAGFLPCKY